MRSPDFAKSYYRTLPDRLLAASDYEALDMTTSRYWSNFLGEMLHDHLSEPGVTQHSSEQKLAITKQFERYAHWVVGERTQLVQKTSLHSTDEAERAAMELHFHALNGGMIFNWLTIIGLHDNSSRGYEITRGQTALALHGLHYYALREGSASKSKNYEYFNAINANHRHGFEARANEVDSAIILLELMRRRKELVVVPAPLQFEKFGFESGRNSDHSPNADFIGMEGNQAVGFQVKNIVRDQDIDHYDTSRIVMIDAGRDLGNERYRRVAHEITTPRLVSWGGTIATQYVLGIKIGGKRSNDIGIDTRYLVQQKMLARSLALATTPYLGPATNILNDRLTHFFASSSQPTPNTEPTHTV